MVESLAGAGGAAYSDCTELQATCLEVLNEKTYLSPSTDFSQIQFSSNLAGAYGNDIATAPSKFVMVDTEHTVQLDLCQDRGLHRLYGRGTLQLNRSLDMNFSSHYCSVTIAPFGASKVSLALSLVEASSGPRGRNQDEKLTKLGNLLQACKKYRWRLEIYECQDLACNVQTLLATCCDSGSSMRSNLEPQTYRGLNQHVARSGIMMMTLYFRQNISLPEINASFDSFPPYESIKDYVPGQQALNLTILRVDGLQTVVPPYGNADVVSASLCALSYETCNMFTSLTPTAFYGLDVNGYCHIEGRQVFACSRNKSSVHLQVSMAGSSFPPLGTELTCLPCRPGESQHESSNDPTWTCVTCTTDQYVIDPNNPRFRCQFCPQGAICDGNALVGAVNGSIWEPDLSAGIYRLTYCPPVCCDSFDLPFTTISDVRITAAPEIFFRCTLTSAHYCLLSFPCGCAGASTGKFYRWAQFYTF